MASTIAVVLNNLSSIIRNEVEFLGGLSGDLQSIKDEFQQMMNFLEGADMLVQDHLDVRSWVDQVRDVAYDVEDVLDEFVMRCTYRHSTRWYGIFQKMYTKSVGAIKTRHELVTRIQKIKKRIRDISETHGRYKTQYQTLLPEHASCSRCSCLNNVQYDKRSDGLLLEEIDLVGIKVPKLELTNILLSGDARRNVVSVVGMGGLGKTTLVKKVYDDVSIRSQFTHHVWITVSESFKLEELFKDVIIQLFDEEKKQLYEGLGTMDINNLKSIVKDFLQSKKYIVVFDDVWQLTHWEAIHLAFPRNQFGSRIVITTRSNEVGQASSKFEGGGCTYHLRALSDQKAMELFCKKTFSGSISCPQHLNQICEKILKACQGLPLAIVVIGSVLATRNQSILDFELFYKRLGVEMERNSQLDGMSKLLCLSYYDLPLHLKNCFLHLSIFPEDFTIYKFDIVAHWIGEGFVEKIDGMTLEEVAEVYLNELNDRCLVQVAQTYHDGSIYSIRVHDIIRHIILVKSSEQNITTICRAQEGMTFQRNVRRLALHGSIIDHSKQARRYCKSIRTFYVCEDVGGKIYQPILSDLLSHGRKLLKVLDLHRAELKRIPNEIFKLFNLKYLNLEYTEVRYVPKSIGMLQSLQTLNLWGTFVKELPIETATLQHLRHLTIGYNITDLPIGVRTSFRIGNLKSLQTLRLIEASQLDNIRIVTEIGKLLQLRSLGITKLKREDGEELCSSLVNLRELRELEVSSMYYEEVIDFQYLKSSDLPRLQILYLFGRLEICPEWISSLHSVARIELRFSKLVEDPLKCLRDLPNLITLKLTDAYEGESLCFTRGGFPKLNTLWLKLFKELRCVTVEENALPLLQQLHISHCRSMEELPTGIENLMHLEGFAFEIMSNELMNEVENLDKQSAAYKRILQIPRVAIETNMIDDRFSGRKTNMIDDRLCGPVRLCSGSLDGDDDTWYGRRRLDRETWTFQTPEHGLTKW